MTPECDACRACNENDLLDAEQEWSAGRLFTAEAMACRVLAKLHCQDTDCTLRHRAVVIGGKEARR